MTWAGPTGSRAGLGVLQSLWGAHLKSSCLYFGEFFGGFLRFFYYYSIHLAT